MGKTETLVSGEITMMGNEDSGKMPTLPERETSNLKDALTLTADEFRAQRERIRRGLAPS